MTLDRLLEVPNESFFLFGARGVGKSTWVKQKVKPTLEIDLLRAETYLELQRNPSALEAKVAVLRDRSWVFIDEIQKLPILLDEVHCLMEKYSLRFVLTGSSARKLKRAQANLLAGRAQTRKMYPFSLRELGKQGDLDFHLQWGTLPIVFSKPKEVQETLAGYLETYLKEEIKEEALVRRVSEFARFLEVAGQLNGQVLNFSNIASETGKSSVTIQSWYRILEETLLGSFLEPFRQGFKVRESGHPKFYWFDVGVARAAAGTLRDPMEKSEQGISLESLILNEIRVYNEVSRKDRKCSYHTTPGVGEIDLIVETQKKTVHRSGKFISIEIKLSKKWKSEFERASRSLHSSAKGSHQRMIGIYTGSERLKINDFEVFPVQEFIDELHSGRIF